MSLKRLIGTLLWLLAVFGNQMVLLFLKMLIWDNLARADMIITMVMSVAIVECLLILQKDGDT